MKQRGRREGKGTTEREGTPNIEPTPAKNKAERALTE